MEVGLGRVFGHLEHEFDIAFNVRVDDKRIIVNQLHRRRSNENGIAGQYSVKQIAKKSTANDNKRHEHQGTDVAD